MRGDAGGYWYPDVVDSKGVDFGPMEEEEDFRVPFFGIYIYIIEIYIIY